MAVGIQNNNNVNGLKVENGAGRFTLYDQFGNPMSYGSGDFLTTPKGVLAMGSNDRVARPLRIDRFGSLMTGNHTPLFAYDYEGTTINSQMLNVTSTTFTAAQVQGAISLNSTASNAANAVTTVITRRAFARLPRAPIQARYRHRWAQVTNSVQDWGFGNPSGTAQIQNGAYFQVTAAGALVPVLTFNSTEKTGTAITGVDQNNYYHYDITCDDEGALFTVQNSQTEQILSEQYIQVDAAAQRMWATNRLPTFVRCYNAGTAPVSAPVSISSEWMVLGLDADYGKPWPVTTASMGRGIFADPRNGTQLANFANNTEAVNATLSNTAAGYTTAGGLFAFAAPAGANTDYLLFGYQVPTGYQLNITGITLDSYNDGAAVATTPTLLRWGIAVNGTAANLTNTQFSRRTLGIQSYAIGAAVGTVANTMTRIFESPLVCESGLFLGIIVRVPLGTATASQVIRGSVNLTGYFE